MRLKFRYKWRGEMSSIPHEIVVISDKLRYVLVIIGISENHSASMRLL
jgi:hypothetical protein